MAILHTKICEIYKVKIYFIVNTRKENNYIIISPVKDEEKYIETTLRSIISQTIKPSLWVIVDDCSDDNTTKIIESYCINHPWIKLLRTKRDDKRQPGAPVINAFNKGYDLIKDSIYDFVVKLDCDLRLDPDYFERLIDQSDKNKKLGISSGIYLEHTINGWVPIEMPSYHAAGACKMVRRECFCQIGGFIPSKGWDTIDEIKAQCKGWDTCHFENIKFFHLKAEGSGIGNTKTNIMHGEIYYATGGGLLFFIFKIVHRMIFGKPILIAGIMMLWGYLRSSILKKKRLVDNNEAQFYKKLLNKRILTQLKYLI